MAKDPLAMFRTSAPKVEEELTEEQKAAQTEQQRLEKEEADKKQKPKEQQFGELKKLKEEAEKRAADLQKEIDEKYKPLEKYSPVKTIADYIESKEGKLDEEAVNNFITRQKTRKQKLTETEQALNEREQKLKNISITESTEWKENYQKPIADAQNTLFATIANVDSDGTIKHPGLVEHLAKSILKVDEKSGEPLSAPQIKAILGKFAAEYEEKTGEEYEIPRINDVVDSVRVFINRFKKAGEARTNWEKERDKNNKERLFNQAKEQEEQIAKEAKARDFQINEFIKGYDYSSIEGVIEKDDLVKEIKGQHSYYMDVMKDPSKLDREYHQNVELIAKGKLFDVVSKKVKALQIELEKEKEKVRSGLPSGGSKGKQDDDTKPLFKKGEDPRSIFK